MTCADAVDFVSALCDGERVPRDAAEHIGQCGNCRARLQDYAILGAELRRAASLYATENAPAIQWALSTNDQRSKGKNRFADWWTKGWEVMRIPRFAFALLILVIVGLSSGLVVVKARSTASGPVVLLTLRLANLDSPWQCALSTTGDASRNWCAGLMALKGGGQLQFGAKVLVSQPDHIALGIRSRFYPPPTNGLTVSTADFEQLPMEQYNLQPGETLRIEIQGLGEAELTGELLDHMPALPLSPREALDPAQGELRLMSPLLLRGRQAIIDFEGGSAMGTGESGAVWVYEPGVGRLIVSAQNFQGAVEGQVNESRIDFELNGNQYHLLAGAPITRAQNAWVQFDPSYHPTGSDAGGGIGWAELKQLLTR